MRKISVLALMMIVSVCGLFAQQAPKYNWFENIGVEVIEYGCVNKNINPQPLSEDYFLVPIEEERSYDKGFHHMIMPIYSDIVLEAWDNFRCLFDFKLLITSEFFYKYKYKLWDSDKEVECLFVYWLDWEHGVAHEWRYYNF